MVAYPIVFHTVFADSSVSVLVLESVDVVAGTEKSTCCTVTFIR